MRQTLQSATRLVDALNELLPSIHEEYERWAAALEAKQSAAVTAADAAAGEGRATIDLSLERQLAERVATALADIETDLTADKAEIERLDGAIGTLPDEVASESVRRLVGRRVRDRIATAFILQTQIRLYLIELPKIEVNLDEAVAIGLANRLDLMNERAVVADAFRNMEVVADRLQSDLEVSASANLGTDPDHDNAFRFDSSANRYTVGVQFDGPLERMAERNNYRAAQITYQRARRSYMAAEDSIINDIRQDLRALELSRFNFDIARQQLITATRQVDEAQFNLRTGTTADSNLTRDLLDALQGLLAARNDLILSWISHEINRTTLFVDLEVLYLDDASRWINEQETSLTGYRSNMLAVPTNAPIHSDADSGGHDEQDDSGNEAGDRLFDQATHHSAADGAEPRDGAAQPGAN
jgi:outer membrane protein TolC